MFRGGKVALPVEDDGFIVQIGVSCLFGKFAAEIAGSACPEPPRQIDRLTDANARPLADLDHVLTGHDAKGVGKKRATIMLLRDGKRLAKTSRPRAQEPVDVRSAPQAHCCDADHRLDGPDQNRTTRFANKIETPMESVGPVDVDVTCRPEHRTVPRSLATVAVRGWLVPMISFGLDNDAADPIQLKSGADQCLGDGHRTSVEECWRYHSGLSFLETRYLG